MLNAADDWWVIAGAAVALHGVDVVEVGDVDVLASERDALSVLSKLGLARLTKAPHPLFHSSVFGLLTTAPLDIEIMAGFCVQTQHGWQPVAARSRERVDLEGVAVFTPSREELAEMLADFGRPKDLARARQLVAHGRRA
ncbi:MAG: hypothetical protein V4701_07910 [Pseudomonadota bacterium]